MPRSAKSRPRSTASRYLVTWEMDADADTPLDAALQCFAALQRRDTTANVFRVFDEDGNEHQIDLQEQLDESDVIERKYQALLDQSKDQYRLRVTGDNVMITRKSNDDTDEPLNVNPDLVLELDVTPRHICARRCNN